MKLIAFIIFILINYQLGRFIGRSCAEFATAKYGNHPKALPIALAIALVCALIVGCATGSIFGRLFP